MAAQVALYVWETTMTATTHARLTVAERAELMAKAARASVVVENRQRLERVKVGLGQMEDTLRRSLEHVRKYDVRDGRNLPSGCVAARVGATAD